jgi:hypothetical protein
MKNEIKADNYNYTRNISKKDIKNFESEMSKYIGDIDKGTFKVLEIKPSGNSWGDYKRTVAQVYDFLKKESKNITIVFDGFKIFQLWLDPKNLKELKDKIDEKFKGSEYHTIKFKNKLDRISLYKVNNKNGLVSTPIERNHILNFKKRYNTIHKVYNKVTGKSFKWEKKGNMDIKDIERIGKKVKDYFSIMQDQLREMYDDPKKSPFNLEDRERENFFKQVRKIWQDRNKKKSSYDIVSKSMIDKFKIGTHLVRRMHERNVSPSKMVEAFDNGKQLKNINEPHIIVIRHENLGIPLDTRAKKIRTVVKRDIFKDMSDQEFLTRFNKDYKNAEYKLKEAKSDYTVSDLRKVKTIDQLMKLMNLTEDDFKKDMLRQEDFNKKKEKPKVKIPKNRMKNLMQQIMLDDKK